MRVTCRAADTLPIDVLLEFQGRLKHISHENLQKLKRSILKHGFSAPIFVWKGVDYHIIDGHQRLKALIELRQDGYDMPLVPVAYIDADSEQHAKEKLLYITSQYGEFDKQGVDIYLTEAGISIHDIQDVRLSMSEFELDAPDFEPGSEDDQGRLDELEPKWVVCPRCGGEFDLREQE